MSDVAKLKAKEDENAKLKRLLADTMLDVAILKNLRERSDDANDGALLVHHIWCAGPAGPLVSIPKLQACASI